MSESTIFVLYEYDYGYLIPESEILKVKAKYDAIS